MAKLNDENDKKPAPLRRVELGVIAEYLGCSEARLRIALRRLAETPSVIEYDRAKALATGPATLSLGLTAEEQIKVLEVWSRLPDRRRQPPNKAGCSS